MSQRILALAVAWIACVGLAQAQRDLPMFTPAIDGVITDAEIAGQYEFPMVWPTANGSLLLEGSGSSIEELSATWYVSWDTINLNISAVVLDNTPDYRLDSTGGNRPYNAQDVIQPVFNPFNEPGLTFMDGQPADEPDGLALSAIYDMVVNTADDFGPDIYRHGPALSDADHASIDIEGSEFEGGYILEASIPWATAMDDAEPSYVPEVGDEHGLGFILLSFNGQAGATPDVASLFTDFGDGGNTIGDSSSWPAATLVEAFEVGAVCDFDGNGVCDLADLDELQYVGLGSDDARFDLNGDGNVDLGDTDVWLQENNSLPGDADLDGDVDASDLNKVGLNWQSDQVVSWADGDFDGNGIVNAVDLNEVGRSWQVGVPAAAAANNATAVPEPSSIIFVAGVLAALLSRARHEKR